MSDLISGGTITAKGRTRRPWSPIAVNKVIASIDQLLDDALTQGIVQTNVAAKIARVSAAQKDVPMFTADEVTQLRKQFAEDRIGHAWELALYGPSPFPFILSNRTLFGPQSGEREARQTFTVGGIKVGLCLEFPGLRCVWTSHHNRTTTNTFRSMQSLVRHPGIAAQLAPNGIRVANGEQEIRFRNGSIIMFGAREQGFGRGLDAVDVEVFDEAQILTIRALEDMVPATNQARHEHGGLIFFLGTPPRPTDPGEAFTVKRQRALDGESTDQMYVEFSADPKADSDDHSEWPVMNPSYPKRTPLESMLRMRENIPDEDSWRREAMGIWPERARHVSIIKPAAWQDLRARGPEFVARPDALGVDMSHGLDISVFGCWMPDTKAHVQEVWAGSSVTAAVEWIAANAGRRIEVVIDDISPASQLIPELQARRVKTRRSTARDMAKGCLLFETRMHSGTLSHRGQQSLTGAVMGARKRPISDAGGWGWDRRDPSVAIHPVVAATLGLLGASSKPMRGEGRRNGSRRTATVM